MIHFGFESGLILCVTLIIIITNTLTLLIVFQTNAFGFVNKHFFVSMTIADLCIGVFIAPFSLMTSLYEKWVYGMLFCHVEAYLATIFWIASIYSLTWMGIDHYLSIRNPDRREPVMNSVRSLCWIAFVWLAALSFCCPPLFGMSRAQYYKEAYMCIIKWDLQKAYFVTAGSLIIIPSCSGLAVTNLYIFTSSYRSNRLEYQKYHGSTNRSDMYFVNFVIGVIYIVAWGPWCILQIYEVFFKEPDLELPARLHFYLMWFAVANSFWKFLVYVIFVAEYRQGLKFVITRLPCSDEY